MQTPAQPPARRPQIVTLTMNPALDVTTSVDVVRPTEKLRSGQDESVLLTTAALVDREALSR